MAKGQNTKRMRKHGEARGETRGRGGNGPQHKGQESPSRPARKAVEDVAKGERRAIAAQQRAMRTSAREMQRVMEETRQATVQAVNQAEEATRSSARTWDSLLDFSQSMNLTRSWMAAAWSLWDASTYPLRSMLGGPTSSSKRR